MQVMCTPSGLVPVSDADYEAKQRLKNGRVYTVDVKLCRNYEFHKKYFALINLAWEYMNDRQCKFFGDVNSFRKTIEVQAGYFERYYSVARKEWLEMPKSIAYDKMSAEEFENLYDRVKDVLFELVLKDISMKEFMEQLIHF